MKKTFLALIIFLTSCTFSYTNSNAEELKGADFGLYLRNIPIMCGEYNSVLTYLKYYEFEPKFTSVGKSGAVSNGDPVYAVVHYVNKSNTETIAVLGVPNDTELCMMYRTFEYKEFNVED